MAGWVKEGDPQAVLYLNDYDILTGSQLEKFVAHVQTMLDRGVSFDGLGVQGHLHSESFKPEALQNALDTLAKFDLPIRITEFNLPGQRSAYMRDRRRQMTPEQEEAKAKAIVDYYTICFAHPAVDGILMWGFWEGANWIPASSLYKRDWTPTPAAHAYHDLIYKQWWTNWTGKADAEGKCTLRAFYGQHRVTVGGQAKNDRTQESRRNRSRRRSPGLCRSPGLVTRGWRQLVSSRLLTIDGFHKQQPFSQSARDRVSRLRGIRRLRLLLDRIRLLQLLDRLCQFGIGKRAFVDQQPRQLAIKGLFARMVRGVAFGADRHFGRVGFWVDGEGQLRDGTWCVDEQLDGHLHPFPSPCGRQPRSSDALPAVPERRPSGCSCPSGRT